MVARMTVVALVREIHGVKDIQDVESTRLGDWEM